MLGADLSEREEMEMRQMFFFLHSFDENFNPNFGPNIIAKKISL
jgi:hypothetical protein